MILLDNYRQIFSLAYLFVRGGSKIFDSCLTKIIFGKKMDFWEGKMNLDGFYSHFAKRTSTFVQAVLQNNFIISPKIIFRQVSRYGEFTSVHGTHQNAVISSSKIIFWTVYNKLATTDCGGCAPLEHKILLIKG